MNSNPRFPVLLKIFFLAETLEEIDIGEQRAGQLTEELASYYSTTEMVRLEREPKRSYHSKPFKKIGNRQP
jgi:hypothetical protein